MAESVTDRYVLLLALRLRAAESEIAANRDEQHRWTAETMTDALQDFVNLIPEPGEHGGWDEAFAGLVEDLLSGLVETPTPEHVTVGRKMRGQDV